MSQRAMTPPPFPLFTFNPLAFVLLTQTVGGDCKIFAVMAAVEENGHFDKTYETIAGCTVSCHLRPRHPGRPVCEKVKRHRQASL